MKKIEVSLNVFAAIWASRQESESTENEVLERLLGLNGVVTEEKKIKPPKSNNFENQDNVEKDQPMSGSWKDVLIWSLEKLGGEASLSEIYSKSREARLRLGKVITEAHNASARECLESHSSDSNKFRNKADLFTMSRGKGPVSYTHLTLPTTPYV